MAITLILFTPLSYRRGGLSVKSKRQKTAAEGKPNKKRQEQVRRGHHVQKGQENKNRKEKEENQGQKGQESKKLRIMRN